MKKLLTYLMGILLLASPGIVLAQQSDVLDIATIERHPFVINDEQGLSGFSIDLWKVIASENNWNYKFLVVDKFVDLLAAPRLGKADAAIANISITADRAEVMDFSLPIYNGGMLIMISSEHLNFHLFEGFKSKDFWIVLATMVIAFLVIGMLLHMVAYKGITKKPHVSGVYWKLITLGSYGHELPKKMLGKGLFILWLLVFFFGSVVAIADFTSSLVTAKQGASIQTPQDLRHKKVGVIGGSTSESFLRKEKISTISYSNIDNLFRAVAEGRLDAVVHDAPVVNYYASNEGDGRVIVAGELFNPENYGVALPTGSELTDQINQTLLRLQENGVYDSIYSKWFSK